MMSWAWQTCQSGSASCTQCSVCGVYGRTWPQKKQCRLALLRCHPCNKSSTFLSGYCTPQEGYIEPFIPAASCGVFWKVLDKNFSEIKNLGLRVKNSPPT